MRSKLYPKTAAELIQWALRAHGMNACAAGYAATDCPYPPSHKYRAGWMDGFERSARLRALRDEARERRGVGN